MEICLLMCDICLMMCLAMSWHTRCWFTRGTYVSWCLLYIDIDSQEGDICLMMCLAMSLQTIYWFTRGTCVSWCVIYVSWCVLLCHDTLYIDSQEGHMSWCVLCIDIDSQEGDILQSWAPCRSLTGIVLISNDLWAQRHYNHFIQSVIRMTSEHNIVHWLMSFMSTIITMTHEQHVTHEH